MNMVLYPAKEKWAALIKRPVFDNRSLRDAVVPIMEEVNRKGDAAIKAYAMQFDGVVLNELKVTKEEIAAAAGKISDELKTSIATAAKNIRKFHEAQLNNDTAVVETMPGVECWYRSVPVERVGLYVPGGSAPLFSTLLMLGIPAKIAGCKEIVVCTPADKSGEVHPAILYTASLLGIGDIYKAGGAQAIAAMAYGTETIPRVWKIFGPGNQYVTAAKQLVQAEGIAIDMPAGPSEVCIIADETADASFIAADLLSQAEHGADSQVLLVCTDEKLTERVSTELEKQLKLLSRKDIALGALQKSSAIVLAGIEEVVQLVNEYAPEHLIVSCANEDAIAAKIVNAGSVFLGSYSPESAGDYASGTNHTLPTNGYAKAYSGVSTDSFMKKISYQRLSKAGLQRLSSSVVNMALAEGLEAHANAVRIRLEEK